ncbi:MAG: hypothetical protein IJP61_10765 [Treponema sp.]|nr:hypothetical protein [Treponema sp.]
MCEKKLAPIVLFVYNRPEATQKTLEALSECYLSEESELFIFADGAKPGARAEQLEKIERTRSIARSKKWCKSVTITESSSNRGLAASVIAGVSGIIDKFGRAIVLEDDIVCEKSFLKYMNGALDFYDEKKHVWSIAGFSPLLFSTSKLKGDVYAGYRASSWGWATWKDRWQKVDWSVSDYGEFMGNKSRQAQFNRGGIDMTNLLSMQMRGECDSWAIRWCYQQFKENAITIFPKKSQVKNIGFENDGTHSRKSILQIFKTQTLEYEESIKFDDCQIDEKIMKEMLRLYSPKITDRLLLVLARIILWKHKNS